MPSSVGEAKAGDAARQASAIAQWVLIRRIVSPLCRTGSDRLQAVLEDFSDEVAVTGKPGAQPFGLAHVLTHRAFRHARIARDRVGFDLGPSSEEPTSEIQSIKSIPSAGFSLKKQ